MKHVSLRNNVVFRTIKKGGGSRIIPILSGSGKSITRSDELTSEVGLREHYLGKVTTSVGGANKNLSDACRDMGTAAERIRGVLGNYEKEMESMMTPAQILLRKRQLQGILDTIGSAETMDKGIMNILNTIDKEKLSPLDFVEVLNQAGQSSNELNSLLQGAKFQLASAQEYIERELKRSTIPKPIRDVLLALDDAEGFLEMADTKVSDGIYLIHGARDSLQSTGIAIGPVQANQNLKWHTDQVQFDQKNEDGNPNQASNEDWHEQQEAYDVQVGGATPTRKMRAGGKTFNEFAEDVAARAEKKGMLPADARGYGYATANKIFQIQGVRRGLMPLYEKDGRSHAEAKKLAYAKAMQMYSASHPKE